MQWESLYRLVERSAGNQHRLQMPRNLQFRNNPRYCYIETEKCVHFIINSIKNLPKQVIKFILTCQKYVKNSHDILSMTENPRLQRYGHSCQYLSSDMQSYCCMLVLYNHTKVYWYEPTCVDLDPYNSHQELANSCLSTVTSR